MLSKDILSVVAASLYVSVILKLLTPSDHQIQPNNFVAHHQETLKHNQEKTYNRLPLLIYLP